MTDDIEITTTWYYKRKGRGNFKWRKIGVGNICPFDPRVNYSGVIVRAEVTGKLNAPNR